MMLGIRTHGGDQETQLINNKNKAAENFDKAISINPKNPVVYSFMGITLAASRDFNRALTYFEKSEKLDNKNGLNRFQKANTLVKLERYDEAVR